MSAVCAQCPAWNSNLLTSRARGYQFGRACGDVYITSVGYIDLRQILNLLFVPSFMILVSNLALILCNYDSLTA